MSLGKAKPKRAKSFNATKQLAKTNAKSSGMTIYGHITILNKNLDQFFGVTRKPTFAKSLKTANHY